MFPQACYIISHPLSSSEIMRAPQQLTGVAEQCRVHVLTGNMLAGKTVTILRLIQSSILCKGYIILLAQKFVQLQIFLAFPKDTVTWQPSCIWHSWTSLHVHALLYGLPSICMYVCIDRSTQAPTYDWISQHLSTITSSVSSVMMITIFLYAV